MAPTMMPGCLSFKALVPVVVVSCLVCEAWAGGLVAPDGTPAPDNVLQGRGHKLLLLVKAWDGVTVDLLSSWNRTLKRRRRRLMPIVIFVKTPRAVANRYVLGHGWSFRWYVDIDGAVLEKVRPAILPLVVLTTSEGAVLWTSGAMDEKLLKLIARNPDRFVRECRRLKQELPVLPRAVSFGPWGPPQPADLLPEAGGGR